LYKDREIEKLECKLKTLEDEAKEPLEDMVFEDEEFHFNAD